MSNNGTISAEESALVVLAVAAEQNGGMTIQTRDNRPMRPIKIVCEDGTTRFGTHGDVMRGLLRKENVEATIVGKRPRVVLCVECGAPTLMSKNGNRKFCKSCADRRQRAFAADGQRKLRERHRDTMTPEQLERERERSTTRSHKFRSKLTDEQREQLRQKDRERKRLQYHGAT